MSSNIQIWDSLWLNCSFLTYFRPIFSCLLHSVINFIFADDCLDDNGHPVSGEPFRNPDDCTTFFQVCIVYNFRCVWCSLFLPYDAHLKKLHCFQNFIPYREILFFNGYNCVGHSLSLDSDWLLLYDCDIISKGALFFPFSAYEDLFGRNRSLKANVNRASYCPNPAPPHPNLFAGEVYG